MYLAYKREMARRREQSQAAPTPADGPMSQPLTPEQEAQAQAEYQLLQQEKAKQHAQREAAVDRLNAAWAATHGYDYKTPDELTPGFWRELKKGFQWQVVEGVKKLGRGIVGAAKQNARQTHQIMDEAQERGIPMTPMGASLAAGVSDTVEGISVDIEACKEDLLRALEAETKTDKAIAALQATLHMGQAALGAYTLAEPVAGLMDGGGAMSGGATLATADARAGAGMSERLAAHDGASASDSTIHQASKLDGEIEKDIGASTKAESAASAEAEAEVAADAEGGPAKWVDEKAHMSVEAREYQASARGARSNRVTKLGQAPELAYEVDGSIQKVRFDGIEGRTLIDRKKSVTTFLKSEKQALRQSEALKQNGLEAIWEVPTEAEAARAERMFQKLGITNIKTRVVVK